MERENVKGYKLGISYFSTALRYKPAFIVTWESARFKIERVPVRSLVGAWRFFKSP